MVFALAGNQNSGKTTLFNQLTGSNQHVGNFPGCLLYTSPKPMFSSANAPFQAGRLPF